MNRSVLTSVGVFVIGILVTIAGFFLLEIEKIALHYWAFGLLLFSLVVSMFVTVALVAPKKGKSSVFYNTGMSAAIALYQIAVIISMFFTHSFKENVNGFIFLQIAINAVFFIALMIITNTSGNVHQSNMNTQEKAQDGEYNGPKRGGV